MDDIDVDWEAVAARLSAEDFPQIITAGETLMFGRVNARVLSAAMAYENLGRR